MSRLTKKPILTEETINYTTVTNSNEQNRILPPIEQRIDSKSSHRLAKYSNTSLFENHIKTQLDKYSLRKDTNIYITETTGVEKSKTIRPSRNEHPVTEVYINEQMTTEGNKDNYATPLLNKLAMKQLKYRAKVSQSQSPDRVQLRKINQGKEISIRDYIAKTREINAMRYSLELKKERATRINEYLHNEINSIDMAMKSMEASSKLFDENFFVKLSEYNKKLEFEVDKERVASSSLFQEVIHLRKEINQLEMRINKKKNDKESIERWVIFQKQVNIISSSPNKYNQTQETSKTNQVPLIYSIPEEFIAVIEFGETNCRNLLENLNSIQLTINYLKKEKEEVELRNIESTAEDIRLIKEKELILEKIKNRYDFLMKDYRSVKMLSRESNINKVLKTKVRSSIIHPVSLLNSNKNKNNNKINTKINELYLTAQRMLANEDSDEVTVKAKKDWSMEKLMLFKLAHIEMAINSIMDYQNYYASHPEKYDELLKSIYGRLDLQRKEQVGKRAKEEHAIKLALLKERIEERNKKVILLPLRKVDLYPVNRLLWSKKKKVITLQKELELEDFLYDIND